MGIDCYIQGNDGFVSLDRWWVFEDQFKSMQSYSQDEALCRLEKIDLLKHGEEKKGYMQGWIEEARNVILQSQNVKFWDEIDYWECQGNNSHDQDHIRPTSPIFNSEPGKYA